MTTGGRDLSACIDRFGNISVDVTIGGPASETRSTGASAPAATVAKFLRELADDVERAGDDDEGERMISRGGSQAC